jgi:pyruvate dehydrogenase E2 component (dihydrolipoamide acetyltransferase)
MAYEFRLPDIGEGIHEGEIVKWLVKVGDEIKEDQPLLEVMTDKVTAEIPSPVTGVIQQLNGKEGEIVHVGSVIIVFGDAGSKPSTTKEPAMATVSAPASNSVNSGLPASAVIISTGKNSTGQSTQRKPGEKVLAAPATRKLARDLGLDLSQVAGSGPRGRVTPHDVRSAIGTVSNTGGGCAVSSQLTSPERAQGKVALPPMPAMPATAIAQTAGERRVPFSGIRKKIAEHLTHSKRTAPHFAYVEEVDMTELVRLRKELKGLADDQGVKLSYLPFIMKAVIAGLKAYPVLNSSLDETTQELVYKNVYNLGVAVDTEQGLVVPVVHNAQNLSILELGRAVQHLAEKARTGKLTLDEMRGGTFTLTSIGSIGGLFGVPIINFPEVGILGINKIARRPVVKTVNGEESIVIRDMMYLSLSCDHRVVDGADGARFVKRVIEYLENPSKLLLEV